MGDCPYENCKGRVWEPIAPNCPAFQKHTCEECKRIIWTYHSRLDPKSYTEEGFLEEYEVNEETKEIKARTKEDAERWHARLVELHEKGEI